MAIRSGLSGQFGFAKETVYGTSVTPVKFLPVGKADFNYVPVYVQGQGMYSGDLGPRAAQNVLATFDGEGTVEMDILNKDMGLLVQALMGTTVTPLIQGAGPAYLQTHTLADPYGKSLTCQIGATDVANGTTRPYTLLGTKVVEAEFTFATTDVAKATFTLDAQNQVESTAIASVSYATGLAPFSAPGGGSAGFVLKTGTVGSETAVDGVTSASVKIDRKSKDDRYYLNNLGKKSEPILNEVVDTITGSINADYLDKTKFWDLYAAGTTTSLVLETTGTLLNASFYYTFRVTIPGIKFNGSSSSPTIDGGNIINTDFPWTWVYDGTNLPKIEIIEVATTL